MAMSVGSGGGGEVKVMATINTTPLVDVMLVLLIIFLITIPVITKTVNVTLPKAVNIPTQTKPENITIAVDKDGRIYWNDKAVPDRDALLAYLKEAAVRKPQPEVHIRADKETRTAGSTGTTRPCRTAMRCSPTSRKPRCASRSPRSTSAPIRRLVTRPSAASCTRFSAAASSRSAS